MTCNRKVKVLMQTEWFTYKWASGQFGTGRMGTRKNEHQDNWIPGLLGTRTILGTGQIGRGGQYRITFVPNCSTELLFQFRYRRYIWF